MARPKKYIIKLSDDEITTLQRTIRNKATCKTVLKRCQILLELDENHGTGLTHAQVANSYAVCPATITIPFNLMLKMVLLISSNTISARIPVPHCVRLTDGLKHI